MESTVRVNGITMNYFKAGDGPPLILLHGNGEDHSVFAAAAERLSSEFTVYAPDSRGHGKSVFDGEINYRDMAEDIFCLITELKLDRPLLFGFSDGGIIGLILAAAHPGSLRALVTAGANLNPRGLRPGFRWWLRYMAVFHNSPLIRLMRTQPDIKKSELARIDIPALVLAGEKDMIRERHTREIAAALPRAECKILEGEDHASYVLDNEKLYEAVIGFLRECCA